MSRRKIGNILAILGLEVKTQKKFEKQSTAAVNDPRIKPNTLNRNFIVNYPNQVWVDDITEIKTRQGKFYLVALFTAYRWILNRATMRSELVELALQRALWDRKPPEGLMVHTDQGSQFVMITGNY